MRGVVDGQPDGDHNDEQNNSCEEECESCDCADEHEENASDADECENCLEQPCLDQGCTRRSDLWHEEGWERGEAERQSCEEEQCNEEENYLENFWRTFPRQFSGWSPVEESYSEINQYYSPYGRTVSEVHPVGNSEITNDDPLVPNTSIVCAAQAQVPLYCDQLYAEGNTIDGSYVVNSSGSLVRVYCEFQTHGPYNWVVSMSVQKSEKIIV